MKSNIKFLPLVTLPGDMACGYILRRAPHIYTRMNHRNSRDLITKTSVSDGMI